MNTEEFTIPMPWGKVAVVAWGDPKDPIVLCFHGLMDNAGSFKRLIQHLPSSFYYVCVDLPGHGLSDHFPPHLPVYILNNLVVYILVEKHFNRGKYIIMGHSYGAQIAFFYAQLYPDKVEKLIMLDAISTWPVTSATAHEYIREKYENFINLDNKLKMKEKPAYTYEECLDKACTQRLYGELTEESARVILERNIKKIGENRYTFNVDQRLKDFMGAINDSRYKAESIQKNPVKCPVLFVLASDSSLQQVLLKSIVSVLKKRRNVKIITVQGCHDVHQNKPDVVGEVVSKFLLNLRKKL